MFKKKPPFHKRPAFLVCCSVLLTVVLLELCSAVALRFMDETPAGKEGATLAELYETDSPGELQKVRDMLAETWGGRQLVYQPFSEYREPAFEGEYVNVAPEGFRRNSKTQPDKLVERDDSDAPVVFVFGGSTTFGYGVADDQTIPARLQELLRKSLHPETTVYNLGNAFDYSTVERIRFFSLLTRGVAPDAAVFIDGLNDFYFLDSPDRSVSSDQIEYRSRNFTYGFIIRKAADFLLRQFRTVQLIRKLTDEEQAELPGKDVSEEDVLPAARRMLANRALIRGAAARFGVPVLFVQQPVPALNAPEAEDTLGRHKASGVGYAVLEGLLKTTPPEDDLLQLQRLSVEGVNYVDSVHYSPRFNLAIAEPIAEQIRHRLAPQPKKPSENEVAQ